MKRTPLIFGLMLLLGACGDDPVKPGDMVVSWTHGALSSTTCGSRGVVRVEARAIQNDEVKLSGTVDCPATDSAGQIELLDLAPGKYRVVVEGLDQRDKGTFIGELSSVSVRENAVVETDDIVLVQKPARIRVDWSVPEGKCGSSDIKEVETDVFFDATGQPVSQGEANGECDAVYRDPDSGDDVAGILYEDLTPNADVVLLVRGLDADGNEIAKVELTPFALEAGDDKAIDVDLTYCPGDPPDCSNQ